MNMPKITGSGFEKAAIGVAVLAGVVIIYKIYGLVSSGLKGAGQATTAVGEAIGGTVYTLINGDANAQVQTQEQAEMAALKAAGNPPVGSDAYNQVLAEFQANGG